MKLKYKFVMNKVADKTVAVAVGADLARFNGFIKMNDTGAFIFSLLQDEIDKQKIIDELCKEYDATREELIEATDEFLSQLDEAGVLNNE